MIFNKLSFLFDYLFKNYSSDVPIFKRYLKVFQSIRRKELDICFLETCLEERMIPSYIFKTKLHDCLLSDDIRSIHRKVLRRSLELEKRRRNNLVVELALVRMSLYEVTSDFCFMMCVRNSVRICQDIIKIKIRTQSKKLINLRKLFGVCDFKVKNTIINLSSVILSNDENQILKFGPSHSIKNKIDDYRLMVKIDGAFFYLNNFKREIDVNYLKNILHVKTADYLKKNKKQDFHDISILKQLAKKDIKICKFDKGNGILVLDNSMYTQKMEHVLSSPQFLKITSFRKNGILPPLKDEIFLNNLLKDLSSNKHIDREVIKTLRSQGSQPAKLYGLPKVHKDGVPMRPVLSMINTVQYKIAKYLDEKLKPLIISEFECKDSFEFSSFISNLPVEKDGEYMASFDISSLFTNIPLVETINLCCDLWEKNVNEHDNLDVFAFRKLIEFSTSNVHFLFNNEWFKQTDGVAMGSPLAPTLASIFLSSLEGKISTYMLNKPLVYKRYVDDVFLIFKNKDHIIPFLNFLNGLHKNIVFTFEEEKNSSISFLDLFIKRNGSRHETEIYRKDTDTGLYTSPESFCDFKYKRNMIKGLIYRSWSLSSSFKNSIKSIDKLLELLHLNGYSKTLLDRLKLESVDEIINKTKSNSYVEISTEIPVVVDPDKDEINKVFTLSLPYSEGFKDFKNSILKSIGNVKINIVSNSHKVCNMFSNKSKTPIGLCSDLVYQYKCNGCNATYIGETARHLCTRVQEHSRVSGSSNISEHNKHCKMDIALSNFKIISSGFRSYWERVTYEALMIKKDLPKINIQNGNISYILRVFA